MTRGFIVGVVWGGIFAAIVAVAVSSLMPLPPRPEAAAMDTSAESTEREPAETAAETPAAPPADAKASDTGKAQGAQSDESGAEGAKGGSAGEEGAGEEGASGEGASGEGADMAPAPEAEGEKPPTAGFGEEAVIDAIRPESGAEEPRENATEPQPAPGPPVTSEPASHEPTIPEPSTSGGSANGPSGAEDVQEADGVAKTPSGDEAEQGGSSAGSTPATGIIISPPPGGGPGSLRVNEKGEIVITAPPSTGAEGSGPVQDGAPGPDGIGGEIPLAHGPNGGTEMPSEIPAFADGNGAAQDGAMPEGTGQNPAQEPGASRAGGEENGTGADNAANDGAASDGAASDGAASDGVVNDGAAQDTGEGQAGDGSRKPKAPPGAKFMKPPAATPAPAPAPSQVRPAAPEPGIILPDTTAPNDLPSIDRESNGAEGGEVFPGGDAGGEAPLPQMARAGPKDAIARPGLPEGPSHIETATIRPGPAAPPEPPALVEAEGPSREVQPGAETEAALAGTDLPETDPPVSNGKPSAPPIPLTASEADTAPRQDINAALPPPPHKLIARGAESAAGERAEKADAAPGPAASSPAGAQDQTGKTPRLLVVGNKAGQIRMARVKAGANLPLPQTRSSAPSDTAAAEAGAEEQNAAASSAQEKGGGDAQASGGASASMSALLLNAEPFENPEGRPLMALVLLDDPETPLKENVLANLGLPLTFAVDANRDDAAARAKRYRDAGFEVVILTDMPKGARPADVEVSFQAYKSAIPVAVAFLDRNPSGMQSDLGLVKQALANLAESGHGFLAFGKGLNTATQIARRTGVRADVISAVLEAKGDTPSMIRRQLDRAAFQAAQKGKVILLGQARPETIQTILLWDLEDRATDIALAPLSAVLLRE